MTNKPAGHKEPIRVLQVISSPEMGGIENQLLLFLQRYDRSRFVVDVVCTGQTEGALGKEYLATNTRLMLCRWSRYVVPFLLRLLFLLRREKYDVIHSRASFVNGAAILAAKLAGVANRVASYHNVDVEWGKPGLLNRIAVSVLQWMTKQYSTKILSVSRANLDKLFPEWQQYPEKYEVCYNGVDIKRFTSSPSVNNVRSELGLPADSIVVGNVGSLRKPKNHKVFIEVAEYISKRLNGVYFLLVGEGRLRNEIEIDINKRGLSNRFVLTGNRNDVPRMLAAMDLFLMPSLYEGFGTVAIEAQATGLPVVASDLACIREALCPAMQEFCRQPNDTGGMAEQVLRLLKDAELRNTVGQKGRRYAVDKFSIDRAVEQLERVYDLARS